MTFARLIFKFFFKYVTWYSAAISMTVNKHCAVIEMQCILTHVPSCVTCYSGLGNRFCYVACPVAQRQVEKICAVMISISGAQEGRLSDLFCAVLCICHTHEWFSHLTGGLYSGLLFVSFGTGV